MRILHVVPSYLPAWRYGGPIRAVHGLARAEASLGHEVRVFTTNADGDQRLPVPTDREVEIDGVRVRYFALGVPARLFRAPEMSAELASAAAASTVVHLHSVFLWPTWRAAHAAGRAGTPYLVSPRGILAPELVALRGALRKRLWIALVERRTLRRAAAIHVTSALEAGDLRALGLDLAPRVAAIPNGVELSSSDSPGSDESDRTEAAMTRGRYWLFLGRLSEKKRIELLIEATALVPDLRLLVAGNDDDGLSPRLASLARSLGVEERVELLGEVRGAAKTRLLGGAVALALASRSENFGNVVLESLAAARPAIVSPGVGAAEVVAASGAGRVVEARADALAGAVRELAADLDLAAEMGRAGRAFVERELSWERIAGRMIGLYEEVLGRRAAGARPVGAPGGGAAGRE